jgi:hypothetical protein
MMLVVPPAIVRKRVRLHTPDCGERDDAIGTARDNFGYVPRIPSHRGAPPKLGEAHKAFLARIGFSRRPTFLSRMSASSKVRG